jgi:hypothetical protein
MPVNSITMHNQKIESIFINDYREAVYDTHNRFKFTVGKSTC